MDWFQIGNILIPLAGMGTGQLEEVHERLDFAERLLANPEKGS